MGLASWPTESDGPDDHATPVGPITKWSFRYGGLAPGWFVDFHGTRTDRYPIHGAAVDQVVVGRSSATWLVDDGIPPNMIQRVMGHERASTTLDV